MKRAGPWSLGVVLLVSTACAGAHRLGERPEELAVLEAAAPALLQAASDTRETPDDGPLILRRTLGMSERHHGNLADLLENGSGSIPPDLSPDLLAALRSANTTPLRLRAGDPGRLGLPPLELRRAARRYGPYVTVHLSRPALSPDGRRAIVYAEFRALRRHQWWLYEKLCLLSRENGRWAWDQTKCLSDFSGVVYWPGDPNRPPRDMVMEVPAASNQP